MRVELDVRDIPSSLIERVEYLWQDDNNWRMKQTGHVRVTFLNGTKYIYEDVPFMIVMNVIGAQDSIGARFSEFIKSGGYKYYKEN
jgi:hypothetical protein